LFFIIFNSQVNEPVTQGLRALHYAVWQKYVPAVHLLLVRGADINAMDECGYSALHLAAEHGYRELTEILLEAGAKVDYREPTDELYPRTTLSDEPLRLALRNKHYVSKQIVHQKARLMIFVYFHAGRCPSTLGIWC
jgi:ankyrin repeat protein